MKPNLLQTFEQLLNEGWREVFSQQRVFARVRCLTLGLLVCLRTHLISNVICATGRQFQDWTADYWVWSRSPWEARELFNPILDALPGLLHGAGAPVLAALDDTMIKKTGRRIPGVAIGRDPMSPPFHVNLCYGVRFVQVSVLVSPAAGGAARALPVRFEFAPPAVKPKSMKRKPAEPVGAGDLPSGATPPSHQSVTPEEAAYKEEKKLRRLPQVGLNAIVSLRESMDARPALAERTLIVSGDGSYTNRLILRGLPHDTVYIGRIRKNAKLHLPLVASTGKANGRPRRYGPLAPTPHQLLLDSTPWIEVRCFVAGEFRTVLVKVQKTVYWRNAGIDVPVQVVVIKAAGYRRRKGAKLSYREPAFLICTDPDLALQLLVQAYVYRWEIGVSSQGHIVQSVKDRPGPKDSGLVAGEASWRESKTTEPSDNILGKECAQRTRLQRTVNADVASLHESPVAETVDNVRKQQGLTETSPKRQLSPAGYQRRHGVKEDVETGEALGARRRNLAEEMPAITVSGKCGHRYQGDGSGRSTGDGRAAKRARREGPGPVSIPLTKVRQG